MAVFGFSGFFRMGMGSLGSEKKTREVVAISGGWEVESGKWKKREQG